eukprot:CAMPEP_0179286130 /NCGR_PEP_ID=MMETSP0797-20121207/39577_1 /TAXON_ID=47934 /ORGANISM="Dinophysis acuminata, Strain DAEP01" /LENGTH=48 /DNA_ID= /DNA_START= /DNA_END= /DNA_ORIENTATION=
MHVRSSQLPSASQDFAAQAEEALADAQWKPMTRGSTRRRVATMAGTKL